MKLVRQEHEIPDDYLEVKAEVFKILRSHSSGYSAKYVLGIIREHMLDVPIQVISKCLDDLME